MISFRYVTIPLVFKTGGLADTVTKENGFVFDKYSKVELLKTIKQAVAAFSAEKKWADLVKTAMQCKFSWDESGKKYIKLYKKVASI